ncbi:hypothetical protein LTR08_003702 [Meristemomyces frigidus]|nr:hypothetical protein LTR08_003702 [Meristemomyces frigidus]
MPRMHPPPPPRRTLKSLAPYILAATTLSLLVYLFARSPASTPHRPPGTPDVVIVTTFDPRLPAAHRANIIENRLDYAARHGYAAFFPNTTQYDLMPNVPSTWSTIPALRHAMTLHPHTPWLFYLTATALIMNPRQPLSLKLLDPRQLESLMIVDTPVVPPDSVIKTFSHLSPARVDFILTQDREGLAGGSLLLRSGEWAKFFLDAWYDPLYRSYNFQKAEGHALEHIVQWHGTVLAKMALVPQRVLNSYTRDSSSPQGNPGDGTYQEGDFVANFHGCARNAARDCEKEMGPLMARWRELRDQERRR